MKESYMRQQVIQALKGYHPISVENLVYPGTPDINCTLGWIELKQVGAWPKRANTPLRVPHFTQQQRVWLRERHDASVDRALPGAYVLIVVDKDWILLPGYYASLHLGDLLKQQLLQELHWTSTKEMKEGLVKCLL